MGVSWCKVASNLDSHPKVRKAGRNGREIFLFALRRNAEPHNKEIGSISADELGPDYLADILQMPVTDAVTGVTAAVTAGLLVPDGARFRIVGWEEGWGKDNGTGAERTARYRENKKLRESVTPVTSRDVTPVTGDTGDTEEKRLEEKREEREPAPAGALKALKVKVDKAPKVASKHPLPSDWLPSDACRSKALDLRLDFKHETEQFTTSALAAGRRYADWDAAFRTWLGNAAKWRDERGGSRGQSEIRTNYQPL